jgi:hypothetical protein
MAAQVGRTRGAAVVVVCEDVVATCSDVVENGGDCRRNPTISHIRLRSVQLARTLTFGAVWAVSLSAADAEP